MQVSDDRRPQIIPLDFRVEYAPQADGTMKEIEVVEFTRKGSQGATTPMRIEHLQRTRPGSPPDPVWLALKPYYENWKAGKAAPIDGTPLAAWPGATPQLVKALEPFHIRSVEDLANLTDGSMDKVPVPGIRGFRSQAKSFVEAQRTTAVVAADLAAKDAEISDLKREMGELKELVAALAAKDGVTVVDEQPRGPGRPRKVAA
jgi:hypothetical protein